MSDWRKLVVKESRSQKYSVRESNVLENYNHSKTVMIRSILFKNYVHHDSWRRSEKRRYTSETYKSKSVENRLSKKQSMELAQKFNLLAFRAQF